jgi:hypothetical protein
VNNAALLKLASAVSYEQGFRFGLQLGRNVRTGRLLLDALQTQFGKELTAVMVREVLKKQSAKLPFLLVKALESKAFMDLVRDLVSAKAGHLKRIAT